MHTHQWSSTKPRHIRPTGFGLVSVSRSVFYLRPVLPLVCLSNGRSCQERRHLLPVLFPCGSSSRSGCRRNEVPGLLLNSLLPSHAQGPEQSPWAQPKGLCYAGILGGGETLFPPCCNIGELSHRCKLCTPESRPSSCSRSSQQRPHGGAPPLEMKPSWPAWWSPPPG